METVADELHVAQLSATGLRAFFRIADLWKLNRDEQMTLLGMRAPATFHNWKRNQNVHLDPDKLERLSYILGIFKALQILLPQPEASDTWVKRANKSIPFGGRSPLDLMLQGKIQNLLDVRAYLDAYRGA